MNVGRLALENLERYGEYTSLHFGEHSYTNLERLSASAALAVVLGSHGVAKDDRVLVQMPNSPEVTAAFQATWRLGAAIVPVTPQLGAREVRYLLEDSGAQTIVTSPTLAARLAEARADLDNARARDVELLVLGASDVPGAVDISAHVAAAHGVMPLDQLADRAPDDMALLLYTSGTTGKPKGVMLTHRNLHANVTARVELSRGTPPFERALHVLPLSHSFGVLVMNSGYLLGDVATLLPHFKAEWVFEAIERHRIQRMSVVPTMLTYMLHFPARDRYDTSSLETVHSGGAALPNEVRLDFERTFGCQVKEGYGLSECSPTATGYARDEPYRPGSVGRAIPEVVVSIRDDAGNELARGESGEICIQGPNVMKGYWNLPEETAKALEGGVLHSGDIGYLDDEGYLFITDRKKDVVIKGGENISPREIEEALYEHPAVAEAAVIGIPDPTFGEDLCAVVALRPGQRVSAEELRAHVATIVTRFKVPSRIEFVDELPKSANNKILKRELKERFSERMAS